MDFFVHNIKTKNHKRVYSILSTIVWVFRISIKTKKSKESVFDIIDHLWVFRVKQYPKQKSKDFPGVMSLSTGF